jgi:hypothetical protein
MSRFKNLLSLGTLLVAVIGAFGTVAAEAQAVSIHQADLHAPQAPQSAAAR